MNDPEWLGVSLDEWHADPFGVASRIIRDACATALEHEGGMNDTECLTLEHVREILA